MPKSLYLVTKGHNFCITCQFAFIVHHLPCQIHPWQKIQLDIDLTFVSRAFRCTSALCLSSSDRLAVVAFHLLAFICFICGRILMIFSSRYYSSSCLVLKLIGLAFFPATTITIEACFDFQRVIITIYNYWSH